MRKIIMFTISGCCACEVYKPKFMKIMQQNSIQYDIIDIMKANEEIKQIAKAFDVYCFPTTLFLNDNKVEMLEGDVSEDMILKALKKCFM